VKLLLYGIIILILQKVQLITMLTMFDQLGQRPSTTLHKSELTNIIGGTDQKMLEGKILTKKRFSTAVEKRVKTFQLSYLDAILEVCDELEFPVEDVARVITPSLKEKITAEAQRLRMIKDSNTATLPI
jgi:hypothetical protein